MDRRFLSILAVLALVFVGIFIVSQKSNNSSSGGKSSSSQPTNHVQGKNAKNVTLIEYGDYQCPICGAYYQPIKQVVEKYSADIKFQFRNLPLTSIHPNAFAAARAAEAAGLQGKYFEMQGMLYENQNSWSSSSSSVKIFESYAKAIGLNMTQYKADYPSAKVNDAINADLNAYAKTKQEQATPSLFINGKHIENTDLSDPSTGAPSVERISKLIDEAIAKQSSSTNN
jgi:protein-disulfide isomerase